MNVINSIVYESIKCQELGLPKPDGFAIGRQEQKQVSFLLAMGALLDNEEDPSGALILRGFRVYFSNGESGCIPIWNRLAYEI